MKTRILLVLLTAVVGAVIVLPREASAVPIFARKYGVNCTMCHSAMPRLNDFGQRYRANGYQLPGREADEKTVLNSPPPVGFRTSAGYIGQNFNAAGGSPNLSDFQMNGLDLLSAGLIGRNVGYFVVYTPRIDGARGVTAQEGSLEMASVFLRRLGNTPWVNVRVGRFEPAYTAFSVKRQLSVSPYEIYDATWSGGPAFSETQTGLELTGHGRLPLSYAAGIVDGSGTNRSIDTPADAYGRLAYVIGPGEGQTAGQRVGVTGYLGHGRPGTEGQGPRESFYRLGADASLNARNVNLAVQFLYAADNKAFWPDQTKDLKYWGGFAELSAMPTVRIVGFARADYINMPKEFNQDVTRVTGGGRYYIEDNIAVHAEVSHRIVKALTAGAEDAANTFFTTRIDFAF